MVKSGGQLCGDESIGFFSPDGQSWVADGIGELECVFWRVGCGGDGDEFEEDAASVEACGSIASRTGIGVDGLADGFEIPLFQGGMCGLAEGFGGIDDQPGGECSVHGCC